MSHWWHIRLRQRSPRQSDPPFISILRIHSKIFLMESQFRTLFKSPIHRISFRDYITFTSICTSSLGNSIETLEPFHWTEKFRHFTSTNNRVSDNPNLFRRFPGLWVTQGPSQSRISRENVSFIWCDSFRTTQNQSRHMTHHPSSYGPLTPTGVPHNWSGVNDLYPEKEIWNLRLNLINVG